VKINRRAAAWVTGGGVTALLVSALALYAVQRDADPSRIVPVDLTYESRTAIRPSEVPAQVTGCSLCVTSRKVRSSANSVAG
jgi:hypothetical protein